MVFAPEWSQARDIGIKLTNIYQKLLKENGIKTKYGAESGFTTEQIRAGGALITLELVLGILEEAVDSLPKDEAKYVRFALDIAASEMYIPEIDMYYIGPEAAGNIDGLVDNAGFTKYKLELFKKHPRFISCEDWADEGEIEHWKDAEAIMGNMIQMGDDFVVSRPDLVEQYTKMGLMNAHLQKPNQSAEESVGIAAVATSHSLNNVVVFSHRGTRSAQEVYTAQAAIGMGAFAGKWTLWGPGRGALIAAMNQAEAFYKALGINVPYQGALVLDPNGTYKDVGWAKRVREEISASSSLMQASQYPPIYYFGKFVDNIDKLLAKGAAIMRELLGGKGANLAEMANELAAVFNEKFKDKGFTLNVPPGFTVTTEQTKLWRERREELSLEQVAQMTLLQEVHTSLGEELISELKKALSLLEEATGKRFGDILNLPLLLSVRSGSKESMPGMMDTILNLGINDEIVLALARATNERFAWDAYRRFVEMFSRTVLGIEEDEKKGLGFKYILQHMIREKGYKDEYDFKAEDYKELIPLYKAEIKRQGLPEIPDDPMEQYLMAVYTVMKSSFNERAMRYREKSGLKLEDTMSAVNILPMVFGNMDDFSGSGVAFSRDLQTGEKIHNLEFNVRCQGEDVVSGRKKGLSLEELRKQFPQMAANLEAILDFLENRFKDVQDVEFTFEHDAKTNKTKLWILQTRNAKRTSRSEIKTAMDMLSEGMITDKETVLKRITPEKLIELFVDQFDKQDKQKALAEGRLLSNAGLDASAGAGKGIIVLDADIAKKMDERIKSVKKRIENGETVSDDERFFKGVDLYDVDGVVLVREETSPDDLGGMLVSKAIWTSRGGRTSHAAVVARQYGIAAVVGDENMVPDFEKRTVTVSDNIPGGSIRKVVLKEGDIISVDGTGEAGRGQVFAGKIKTLPSSIIIARYKETLDRVREAIKILEAWQVGASAELRSEYDKHIKAYKAHIEKYEKMELSEDEKAFYKQYQTVMTWANELRKNKHGLGGAANAETPFDIFLATLLGAENFGLVRTEHMFSGDGRELKFQKFILAKTPEERLNALKALLPLQQSDFEQIFIFADGRPVTIRLIDPPLHEFLPKSIEKIMELALAIKFSGEELEQKLKSANDALEDSKAKNLILSEEEKIELFAKAAGLSNEEFVSRINEVKAGVKFLHEDNPMFGSRGCRLGVQFAEIIEMQVRAKFLALKKVKQAGKNVELQIMVPLVGNVEELWFTRKIVEKIAKEEGIKREDYLFGTMIEIVAGAENIDEIAKEVDFISFGTNDKTQGVLKISRDDGKEWLRIAQLTEIFEDDPFVTLSPEVALFIERVVTQARKVNPKIKIGICGEHGVDIKSIKKYLSVFGLDYVSGSSRKVPGALLAAAQVAGEPKEKGEVEKAAIIREDRTIPVAQEAKRMVVTVRTDRPIKTDNAIGMIETESALLNNEIRFEIQKFLLDKSAGDERMVLLVRYFSQYIKEIAKPGEHFSIKFPDLALGDIFKYKTQQEFDGLVKYLSNELRISENDVIGGIKKFNEANNAIGTRGMRAYLLKDIAPLYIAIAQGALKAAKENGTRNVDFILPFLVNGSEVRVILDGYKNEKGERLVYSLREALQKFDGAEGVNYRFGAEIQTPAAAVTAKDMAKHADFLVIDVKKLTEAVWAAFEGDAKRESGFFDAYMANGIWDSDIFVYAPKEVKRRLIPEAINSARLTKPGFEVRVVTNSKDKAMINLSQELGVNSLIVTPEDAQLTTVQIAGLEINSAPSSASSGIIGNPGGIDFRSIPMLTKPMGSLSGLSFNLPKVSSSALAKINLEKEYADIQNMLKAGIIPSGERLKEYVAACYYKGELSSHMEEIVTCLVEIFRLEEENVVTADNATKEVMLILDVAA
ncbi:MAG: putative PEP-binding protein [Candidatus Omnitrophota bacterium]